MRSNQLSYLAIAVKASAKIEQFSKLAKYLATFFKNISKFIIFCIFVLTTEPPTNDEDVSLF